MEGYAISESSYLLPSGEEILVVELEIKNVNIRFEITNVSYIFSFDDCFDSISHKLPILFFCALYSLDTWDTLSHRSREGQFVLCCVNHGNHVFVYSLD